MLAVRARVRGSHPAKEGNERGGASGSPRALDRASDRTPDRTEREPGSAERRGNKARGRIVLWGSGTEGACPPGSRLARESARMGSRRRVGGVVGKPAPWGRSFLKNEGSPCGVVESPAAHAGRPEPRELWEGPQPLRPWPGVPGWVPRRWVVLASDASALAVSRCPRAGAGDPTRGGRVGRSTSPFSPRSVSGVVQT